MESFEEVVSFLFESKFPDTKPQIGVADETKKALAWWPGKKNQGQWRPDPKKIRYFGCTNRAYPDSFVSMQEQDCSICWAGIDIDGEDNPHLSFNSLVERVAEIIGPYGSIRTSCGGAGLHVLFRLEEPISVGAESAKRPGHLSALTKMLSQPWADALEAAGIHLCKRDSRMFWLYGGLNRWIYRSSYKLPHVLVTSMVQNSVVPGTFSSKESLAPSMLELGDFVTDWLLKLGAVPGPVYVGTIVERLRACGEKVSTRSGCSGNGQINGYIDAGPGWIQLWSYADGHAIWRAVDVDGMLGGEL